MQKIVLNLTTTLCLGYFCIKESKTEEQMKAMLLRYGNQYTCRVDASCGVGIVRGML